MLEAECPSSVNLTKKPWCKHKVIVVIADGDVGRVPDTKHYFSAPDVHLPDNLLDRLAKAGTVVNTFCTGYGCSFEATVCAPQNGLRRYRDAGTECLVGKKNLGYTCKDILEKIARATGGRLYN